MPRWQYFDDVVWEKSEGEWEESKQRFRQKDTLMELATLMQTVLVKRGKLFRSCVGEFFNITYRIMLEGKSDSHVVLRIPWPVPLDSRQKKSSWKPRQCDSSLRILPIPRIHYCGSAEGNPTGLGTFLIIDENQSTLATALITDECIEKQENYVLDPNAPEEISERVYSQMASYMLKLSRPAFTRIGSLNARAVLAIRPFLTTCFHIINGTNSMRLPRPSPQYRHKLTPELVAVAELPCPLEQATRSPDCVIVAYPKPVVLVVRDFANTACLVCSYK